MYTERFGGERVTDIDVLSVAEGREVTRIVDLQRTEDVPSELYDCIVCTQTLQFLFDTEAAIGSLHKMLKPNGSLLLTVPGVAQICPQDAQKTGEYWRFTDRSVSKLLETKFPVDLLNVITFGNVMSAVALLHGISAEELTRQQLGCFDADYPVIVGAAVTKSG